MHIYTDGSVYPKNPGTRNGWCAILSHGKHGMLISGYVEEENATNNRAEVLAIIHGLEALKRPSKVTLHTDSMYCIRAITKIYETGAAFNKNQDLFKILRKLLKKHEVTPVFVKGHNGNERNVMADKYAGQAAKGKVTEAFRWTS